MVETQLRLTELQAILTYPKNQRKLSRDVTKIINDIPTETFLPAFPFKKAIPIYIKPLEVIDQ